MRKRWYAAAGTAALALLLVAADTASAQRWGRGGWGGRGYYGGYGGYGYGSGYGWGGYGYRPGYGGYGYAPGYGSGYAPSYGYGSPYYAPGYVSSGVTTLPGGTTSFYYQPGTQMRAAGYAGGADANAAVVDVRVPPDAQVSFDGEPTRQRGPNRVFSSPPLDPGKTYHYDVTARWTQDGRPVERKRRVDVRAGQRATVDFTRDQSEG
jgi:uncharacterized protein (TIGR03000 family)